MSPSRSCRATALRSLLGLLVVPCVLGGSCGLADVSVYQPGVDPGVGFNLVSWANFANGEQIWQDAVQSVFDAGFDEVSLSPVRFYTIGTGTIAASSNKGPALSHVAAGVARAKSLGMRVTVNPFVEPVNFTEWRGFYNPVPGSPEAITFWNDYQDYLVEVAQMASANGADSMTVGTELRAITRNSGNNANWNSVINAVDQAFSGTLGYAANWDNYNHPNVAAAIWDHPAIDFMGIDSYFPNMLSGSTASQSGAYPDADFIADVQAAWSSKLDTEILPYAAARQSGGGLPVKFTEVGYLPYDQTTVTPQNSSGSLDPDEQNMGFEGLMRALDGRRASGTFLATHVWQWDMPGSSGSAWNMNPAGGNQPTNQQTALWLSAFVKGTNTDPGGDPDPPQGATQVLYSFESGLEGFYYPNFESEPPSTLSRSTDSGVTHGDFALAITKPTEAWTWDARVDLSGTQLSALQQALANNAEDYVLQIDVTYVADDLPAGLTFMDMHVSLDTNLDGWNQVNSTAPISARTDQTVEVQIPLDVFQLSAGIGSAALHLGFAGDWPGSASATMYVDRIALRDTTYVAADNPDFNGDGIVSLADYAVWRDSLGQSGTGLAADGNHDGTVDAADYDLWKAGFTTAATVGLLEAAVLVPEVSTSRMVLLGLLSLACTLRRSL